MKTLPIRLFCALIVCCAVAKNVFADLPPANELPEEPNIASMAAISNERYFDPNTNILVYDPYLHPSHSDIQAALDVLGANNYIVKHMGDPVTLQDLLDCDIFVVGWNENGNVNSMSGIDPNDIETAIKGRVILTGHDADWHTARDSGTAQQAAERFLGQSIAYVLDGPGIGMIALADFKNGFNDWIPASWQLDTSYNFTAEQITSFTDDGLNSGIFNELTPNDMSNWGNSYHVKFNDWAAGFVPYEIGMYYNENNYDVVTIGTPVNINGFIFYKDDGLDPNTWVSPGDTFTYTIYWENTSGLTLDDMYIVDYLPIGVDYNVLDFDHYDPSTHTYTEYLGQLIPEASGSITIPVIVNQQAQPLKYLHNVAILYQGSVPLMTTTEDTFVDDWKYINNPNYVQGVIYVDKDATGYNTGNSWQHAYTDLQDGLWRAETRLGLAQDPNSTVAEIWVADGSYSPGNEADDTFEIPNLAKVFGGFVGTEYERNQLI